MEKTAQYSKKINIQSLNVLKKYEKHKTYLNPNSYIVWVFSIFFLVKSTSNSWCSLDRVKNRQFNKFGPAKSWQRSTVRPWLFLQVFPVHRKRRLKAKLRWQRVQKESCLYYCYLRLSQRDAAAPFSPFLSTRWNDKLLMMQLLSCFTKWGSNIRECATDILKWAQTEKCFGFSHEWRIWTHSDTKKKQQQKTLHWHHWHCCFLLGFISHFNLGGSCDRSVRVSCGGVVSVQLAIRWAHHLHRADTHTHTLFICKPKQRLARSHERFILPTQAPVFLFGYSSVVIMKTKKKLHQNMARYIYSSLCCSEFASFASTNETKPPVCRTAQDTFCCSYLLTF